jgi:hypothetical protein
LFIFSSIFNNNSYLILINYIKQIIFIEQVHEKIYKQHIGEKPRTLRLEMIKEGLDLRLDIFYFTVVVITLKKFIQTFIGVMFYQKVNNLVLQATHSGANIINYELFHLITTLN